MSKLKTKEPEAELGLQGKGVETVEIPEIDALVKKYRSAQNKVADVKSDLSTVKEALKKAESNLIEEMHKHAERLRDPDGALIYSFEESIVSLVQGEEVLTIESKEGQ